MKVTTVEWFCDKCGDKMSDRPAHSAVVQFTEACSARVTIEWHRPGVLEYEQSMLCERCKREIIDAFKNSIKGRRR